MKKLFILIMIVSAVIFIANWIYQTYRFKKDAHAQIGKGQIVFNWVLLICLVGGLIGTFVAPKSPLHQSVAKSHVTSTTKKSQAKATSKESSKANSKKASAASVSSTKPLSLEFTRDVMLNRYGQATVIFKTPGNTKLEITDFNNKLITTVTVAPQDKGETYTFTKPGWYHITATNGKQKVERDLVVRGR